MDKQPPKKQSKRSPNLRWLIFRTNPGSKRPGPVCLSLNESVLPTEKIMVLLDSVAVQDQALIDSIIASLSNESSEPIRAARRLI